MTPQEDLFAPTIFLYATDNRLRSSVVNCSSFDTNSVTLFIAFAMSSYLSACSANFACWIKVALSAIFVRYMYILCFTFLLEEESLPVTYNFKFHTFTPH